MKKASRQSTLFYESVLKAPTPEPVLSASEAYPGLYHTASVVHKHPGRHKTGTLELLQPLITTKKQLRQVQQSLLNKPESPTFSLENSPSKNLFRSETTFSLRKIPISKADGELLMFKEVFVQPQRDILDQVKTKLALHRGEAISKNPRLHPLAPRSDSVPTRGARSKLKADRSYLNQQIQVQPPEGLNASVAAPLTPGGGWAPSIPSGNKLNKSSLKDVTMRATAGVQAGDVQKEAHMAYCLGVLNEQRQNYKEAGKYYKRFFFCARLLDDPIGAALGLNRLGVVYYNQQKCAKSLKFHLKHCEFSDIDNKFVALYNLGICHRVLGRFVDSSNDFTQALAWASERQDLESQCISLGQLGATNLASSQRLEAFNFFKASLELSHRIRNDRLKLDALLALGFLAFQLEEVEGAGVYFSSCIPVSVTQVCKTLLELSLAEQAACNVGIAEGERLFEETKEKILILSKELE